MAESSVPGLKQAMRRAGYTQKTLSEKMGLSMSTIARWSNGEQEPSIAMIKKISAILNCSITELLGITEAGFANGCTVVQVKDEGSRLLITIAVEKAVRC